MLAIVDCGSRRDIMHIEIMSIVGLSDNCVCEPANISQLHSQSGAFPKDSAEYRHPL
jgi:hypothetical protein